MSPIKRVSMRRLFELGWSEAYKHKFTEAPGGTHNTKCTYMFGLIPYLNLKFDKSDVIIDIGYGTGRLLFAFSAMLGTKVYGTDIEEKVFIQTKANCENLKLNLAKKKTKRN
jgi:protein-L-isoaspartate O-methyltransferase